MRAVALSVFALVACGPQPLPVAPGPPPPDIDLAGERDPINTRDLPALRANAQRIMFELVATLPDDRRSQVEHAAFVADGDRGDINAYATCAGFAQPVVSITDELLTIIAYLSAARAAEEVFDVDATNAYIDWMASHQREHSPLVSPPDGREDPLRRIDRRKLARQHELFDETVAWVIGHELAHHYLNHLRCNKDGGILDDAREIAVAIVPGFHQPDELAADIAGITSTLVAGNHRAGYTWTQRGALLLLDFFARQHALGVPDIVFAFAQTHPLPQIRVPIIKGAVATWHVSNGVLPIVLPYPTLPLARR